MFVSPSVYEPIPGWVDNLNGPTGLMVGAAKGVIRSMLIDETHLGECIPVDYAINGLIGIAYEFCTLPKPEEVPVYNITCAERRKRPWGDLIKLSKQIGYDYPLEFGLWYPDGTITTNKLHHQINVIFFHWLPAYLIDFLMLILGQKRFMVHVQNRISVGLEVLQFFTMRQWTFKSTKFEDVWTKLNDKDKIIFNMDMDDDMPEETYLINGMKGGRQYIMHEPLETLPRARRQMKIAYVVDRFCKAIFLYFVGNWLLRVTGIWAMLGY